MQNNSNNFFELTNTTKAKLPSLAFVDMKNAVLGEKYELSLAIVSKKHIQELNKKHRNINEPTDILSFPLNEDCGEIFINIEMTKIEAKKFSRSFENFLAYLFIHGLVHLKGYDHGSTMEELELRYRTQFGV